jgi:hypothetical protein
MKYSLRAKRIALCSVRQYYIRSGQKYLEDVAYRYLTAPSFQGNGILVSKCEPVCMLACADIPYVWGKTQGSAAAPARWGGRFRRA